MQLNCPSCGTLIQATDINIQDKIAVCSNCDTVFEFNTSAEKAKRRKVKQPADMRVRDTDTLTLSFRTNWRLERNQQFIMSAYGTGLGIFVANALGIGYLSDGNSVILPIMAVLFALACFYSLLLTAYNHTEIIMDADKLTITRKPLPTLLNQTQSVSLHGVESIKCAETPISKRENYDTPRYIVWAETIDGNRRTIVTDVVEEYAYFITQKLQENLYEHTDISHLEDHQDDREHISYYEDDSIEQQMNR
ncbi:MAG: hypothetical protein WBC91_05005 [Phototrophicaceae bacterium]